MWKLPWKYAPQYKRKWTPGSSQLGKYGLQCTMGLFEYRQTAPLYQKVLYTHKAEVDAIAQQKSLSQNNKLCDCGWTPFYASPRNTGSQVWRTNQPTEWLTVVETTRTCKRFFKYFLRLSHLELGGIRSGESWDGRRWDEFPLQLLANALNGDDEGDPAIWKLQ